MRRGANVAWGAALVVTGAMRSVARRLDLAVRARSDRARDRMRSSPPTKWTPDDYARTMSSQFVGAAANRTGPPIGIDPQDTVPIEYGVRAVQGALGVYQPPHCDAGVLHPRGTCAYCDMPQYDLLHEYRDKKSINHTGERDPHKKPCPAEAVRRLGTIHQWHRNRPRGAA